METDQNCANLELGGSTTIAVLVLFRTRIPGYLTRDNASGRERGRHRYKDSSGTALQVSSGELPIEQVVERPKGAVGSPKLGIGL